MVDLRLDLLRFELERMDDWKRIGPNQRGSKCNESRGWYGVRGGCVRGKKGATGDDLKAKRKESAEKLAEKIRAKKGMKPKKEAVENQEERSLEYGPPIAKKNVVSVDPRFTAKSVSEAFERIDSVGAKGRISMVRQIIEDQGIQVVFNSDTPFESKTSRLLEGIESKPFYDEIERKAQEESIKKGESYFYRDMLEDQKKHITGEANLSTSLLGFTSPESRHVVVYPKSSSSDGAFSPSSYLRQNAESLYGMRLSANPPFRVGSFYGGDDKVFMTYLHELGHQVKWIAHHNGVEEGKHPPLESGITKYSRTNSEEQFAEHFSLWLLDGERMRKDMPEMHDYIDKSVKAAQNSKRRID